LLTISGKYFANILKTQKNYQSQQKQKTQRMRRAFPARTGFAAKKQFVK
jgi:hypothetical protein